MRQVEQIQGEMRDFVSNIEFALNFEDRRDSVKIRKGETVQYDGLTAKYVTGAGQEVIGRTPSLAAAIRNNWLELKAAQKSSPKKKTSKKMKSPPKDKTYDEFKGGNFDEFVRKNMGGTFSKEVIPEQDLLVKSTNFEMHVDGDETPESKDKLEVAGDQVAVKNISGATTVSSSTAVPQKRSHETRVVQSEDYGADSTQPMQTKKQKQGTGKKKSFTVDETTPAVQDGASKGEVARAKGVIDAEESQDAQVVGSIKGSSTKDRMVEGITMRKTKSKSGGDTQDRRVVKKIGKKKSKKASTTVTEVTPSSEGVKVVARTSKGAQSYLDMMPDDWGSLHWVRKEKFIKSLDDPEFIKFILRVETVNAVQKACKARLEELEQKKSS